jgi:hypothetical protein
MEDESGHGTLPITTQSPRSSAAGVTPLLKLGGKATARCPKFKQRYPRGGGFLGLQTRALSNAQHEQRHEADATEQRRESHRIVFEPMPIRKHDTISCYRHFFLGSDRGGGSGPARKLMSPGCLLYCLGLPWRPSSGG